MIITGVSVDEARTIVAKVSAEQYNGNLAADISDKSGPRTVRANVKMRTLDSYAHGSRTSASGRHGRYASWQAFRDVLTAVFDHNPQAVVRTSLITYRGRDHFLSAYPSTYYTNVGSLMGPAYFGSLSV